MPVPLILYVSGDTANSRRARQNVDLLCGRIEGGCNIDVIDIKADPEAAESHRVLATPMLLLSNNERMCRVIGDLSDIEQVIDFLGLQRSDAAGVQRSRDASAVRSAPVGSRVSPDTGEILPLTSDSDQPTS